MKNSAILAVFVLMFCLVGCGGATEEAAEPTTAEVEVPAVVEQTPDEQVAGLEQMCAEAMEAITARQAEASLYDRVGGRDGIHTVVVDTVERHQVNEPIKHLFEGVNAEHLIAQVTDFLVVATGGEGEYSGMDMVAAHANMGLTNAAFLAAGGDLGAAMESSGWGENESQELLCAFVSLRGDVVTQ